VVSIVLLVVFGMGLVMLSFFSLFLTMASDGCTGEPCDYHEMGLGIALAGVGTWVPFVASLAGVIVQVARRRLSWWIPLVGVVVALGVFAAGVALVSAGGPPS